MKFRSFAAPEPSLGVSYAHCKEIVVPDQGMSLKEILERFTRGEPVEQGHPVSYGEDESDNPLNVDLEKLRNSDLVEKAEYADKLKEIQKTHQSQERKKSAKIAADKEKARKLAEEERINQEVEKRLKKGGSEKSA